MMTLKAQSQMAVMKSSAYSQQTISNMDTNFKHSSQGHCTDC